MTAEVLVIENDRTIVVTETEAVLLEITGPTGPAGANGTNGTNGTNGVDGTQGAVGPAGAAGTNGVDGAQGPAGPVGANGAPGAAGQGVPVGGTAGQVLSKIDSTDFNTAWINPPSGGGGSSLVAASRCQGLRGKNNATTPLSKYDLSADAVVLRNSAGGTITFYNTGTITNDLGLAGPAVNGRDQAAAFTVSTFVYEYFVSDGTTLATVTSPIAPAAFNGSTLPSGYTYWALATVHLLNSLGNLQRTYTNGKNVIYDIDSSTLFSLSQGKATTMTAVTLAWVPPIALTANCLFLLDITHSSAGVRFSAFVRPTGSTHVGTERVALYTQVANIRTVSESAADIPVGTNQQIDYRSSGTPSSGIWGISILVLAFAIANGDS